jgi:hypothetical protein
LSMISRRYASFDFPVKTAFNYFVIILSPFWGSFTQCTPLVVFPNMHVPHGRGD